ncbi:MAG TPA: PKD domain-containing protein [Bacteroidales bacterium]|nr:PKD domain-containing protein [Bacteroidales bacterium]HSA43061.1 PKD domain-containing protein [Bacteroidales bacterium]
MKRLFLLFASVLLFAGMTSGQTVTVQISGTITELNTGNPVPNHLVQIVSDSLFAPVFFYYNAVYTDPTGYYEDFVIVPANLQIMFILSTLDCNGNYQWAAGVSTNAPIVADFQICTGSSNPCQVSFYAIPDSTMTNLTFQFQDASQGNPFSWLWDFGDGTTSTLQNPLHTYAQAGYYYVCLTITGTNCTSTSCDTVVAGFPPMPCGSSISCSYSGLTVSFLSNAWGGTPPYTYNWQFGDGNVSNQANPVHTYAMAGTYTVILTVADAAGCTSGSGISVTVGNNPSGTIWGQVMAGNQALDFGIAYLYIGTGGTNAMMMIDSMMIDSSGLYHFYLLNPLPGVYYVKVAPTASSAFFNTHLPTYYGNTIFWTSAFPIYLNPASGPYDIQLIPVTFPVQGNGTIYGQITNGGAFVMQSGTPAPNVEVILLNMSNIPLALDYSDNQGYFGFSGLGMGTYKVYAEVPGLTTYPAIVTLSASNPAYNNLSVVITPSGVITGIRSQEERSLQLGKVYPNPSTDQLLLEFSLPQTQELELSIFDLLGNKLLSDQQTLAAGTHCLKLMLDQIASGQYMLKVSTAGGTMASRKITVIK